MFDDSDHAAGLFNLEMPGHLYSRLTNPTVAVLEERLAALEGGVGAVCTASGQAAFFLGVVTLMGQGGHIVASRNIYGGTHQMLNVTLPRLGITTTFVDPQTRRHSRTPSPTRPASCSPKPSATPASRSSTSRPSPRWRTVTGSSLMVDSTFSTPYCIRPIEHGADIVMHSVTKFLGGHGVALGGALVDGGRFDWEASGRFDTMTEPYVGYHGISFADEFGPAAFITRARAEGLRDFGAAMSPPTPSSSCRASKRSRCAWRDTSRMPEPSPRCLRRTMPWPG